MAKVPVAPGVDAVAALAKYDGARRCWPRSRDARHRPVLQ
jgi:hypothetical protein